LFSIVSQESNDGDNDADDVGVGLNGDGDRELITTAADHLSRFDDLIY